jgi:hypothetical protein
MLNLYAVPEPTRITMRSHSFRAAQELLIRLVLVHTAFEYRYDGHWHIITAEAAARCVLGSPTFQNGSRIVVEEG